MMRPLEVRRRKVRVHDSGGNSAWKQRGVSKRGCVSLPLFFTLFVHRQQRHNVRRAARNKLFFSFLLLLAETIQNALQTTIWLVLLGFCFVFYLCQYITEKAKHTNSLRFMRSNYLFGFFRFPQLKRLHRARTLVLQTPLRGVAGLYLLAGKLANLVYI